MHTEYVAGWMHPRIRLDHVRSNVRSFMAVLELLKRRINTAGLLCIVCCCELWSMIDTVPFHVYVTVFSLQLTFWI